MKPRGRPRNFDRDLALRRAMEVFWAVGYEAATLEELQAAMGGLSPTSVYNAFGSKEQLFREVVELYRTTVNHRAGLALLEQPTVRGAIEAMLREAVDAMSHPGWPRGCLVATGAMTCNGASNELREYLRGICRESVDVIKRRLERAVAAGELRKGIDVAAIASFYATVGQGLTARARDGTSRTALMAAVDGAMAAWPALTTPRRRQRQHRSSQHHSSTHR